VRPVRAHALASLSITSCERARRPTRRSDHPEGTVQKRLADGTQIAAGEHRGPRLRPARAQRELELRALRDAILAEEKRHEKEMARLGAEIVCLNRSPL
jgi:hypothetical protein